MRIVFYINFRSVYGQQVFLRFSEKVGNYDAMLLLEYADENTWIGEINAPEEIVKQKITATIILKEEGKPEAEGKVISIVPGKVKSCCITVFADWYAPGWENAIFNSKAFSILAPAKKEKSRAILSLKKTSHFFQVKAPEMPGHLSVCISGNLKELGNWEKEKCVLLKATKNGWKLRLSLKETDVPIFYKYGIYDKRLKKLVTYEDGKDRSLPEHGVHRAYIYMQENIRVGEVWKAAGLNVPVSALKSRKSWGTGDFSDLISLIDWASASGLTIVQLLPVNDTTVTHTLKDAYPYAAISAFALHPLYLNVQKLMKAAGIEVPVALREQIQLINDAPTLDYEMALACKQAAIELLYEKDQFNFKDDFAWFEFMEINRHWLVPYAAFCYLRDKYKTANVVAWEEHSVYDEDAIQELVSPETDHYPKVAIHYYAQFHLHLQLTDAVDYAYKKNIILKGDLPIGVNTFGVDTWMSPHLFHMHMQAGAPPDAFTNKGQNWGFPTYNWATMEADGFSWWRQRMEHLSNYFDAIRIDHVLGFFRIWSMTPDATEGLLGRFAPAHPMPLQAFRDAGIELDENIYTKPLINDDIIYDLFGEEAEWVKANCLEGDKLSDTCNTQRKVTQFFKVHHGKKHIEEKMLWLVAQVILLKDETLQEHYHFRINMQDTAAFHHLTGADKQSLEQLYESYFFHNQNDLWKAEGIKKLKLLDTSSPMFICAEDLGMVPPMVPDVLNSMHMAGLVVQRMPQKSTERFADIRHTSFLTVVTPSTHDMSPLRLWWKEDREATQYFYNHVLGHYGQAPEECEPWIVREIIEQHLQSRAIFAIFLLQDLLATDEGLRRLNPVEERINNPANPDHYWNYRMHLYLEDLKKDKLFSKKLQTLITENGR